MRVGISMAGEKEILGLWIAQTEGAKFWMKVFNDLKTRGVADILIAVTEGKMDLGDRVELPGLDL